MAEVARLEAAHKQLLGTKQRSIVIGINYLGQDNVSFVVTGPTYPQTLLMTAAMRAMRARGLGD